MILQIMKTKQYFGTTALLGHRAILPGPEEHLTAAKSKCFGSDFTRHSYYNALKCFSTLRYFLTYQIPILLQVIRNIFFFL